MGTDKPSAADSSQLPEFFGHSTHDAKLAADTTPASRVAVPETSVRGSAHDARLAMDTTPASRVTVTEPSTLGRSAHDTGLAVDTTPTSRVDVSTVPSPPAPAQNASTSGDQQQ